jgi:hypothetical protein
MQEGGKEYRPEGRNRDESPIVPDNRDLATLSGKAWQSWSDDPSSESLCASHSTGRARFLFYLMRVKPMRPIQAHSVRVRRACPAKVTEGLPGESVTTFQGYLS